MDEGASTEGRPSALTHEERLDRALVAHVFRLMPTSIVGVAIPATIFVVGAIDDLSDRRVWTWMGLQQIALVVNLAVLWAYRRGRFGDAHGRARAFQRLGVVLAGAVWGVGSVLWPLEHAVGPGFALVFCYAGMCAGGATTLAGDPIAYVLFATTALVPSVLASFPGLWWISALLVAFVLLTSYTVLQNERTLRESLALRFENDELLEEAIHEREAAQAAHAEADRAAHARTRFLAAASHDLRQPVQAMSLFVDVLGRDPELGRDERMRAVQALGRSTDALRAMLEALLDVSRLDAGIVATTPTSVALEPLFAEVIAAQQDEADAKDMVVHAMGRPTTVFADPASLSRVVHNLVANAVRHGGRGRVLLAARRNATHARIQVWDQGVGIAPEDRERIFEEFVQLGNRERDRAKGLGLGLPIVKRLCDRNGWALRVRSTPGRGSVFTVVVPLAAESSNDERASRRGAEACRALLVEDDLLVREALASFLSSAGCEVVAAGDGEEASARLEELRAAGRLPDVLVTDHRLPGAISGADLVRRYGDDLPCILLTGDVDDPFAGEAPRADRIVLRKPVSGEALEEAMRRVHGDGDAERV
ncbi:MAG: ATP-binding protein [Polyangiales bacterium]